MTDPNLRPMQLSDWSEVAELICVGTNYWYQTHGMGPIFANGPESTLLFCQVYEALDPGCCILAEHPQSGRIMGSCFYHPRETHVSLGIMNVHPNYFGMGVASALLNYIIDVATRAGKPVRLVSSALNLDSFSLYTRAGFVPRQAFQDMSIAVPAAGLAFDPTGSDRVRMATPDDAPAMAALEREISGIEREKDYGYFIQNELGIWRTVVYESESGAIDGFLVSVQHPGSNLLGPGIMRTPQQAAALIHAQLNQNKGRSPVFLVPVAEAELVQTMYSWGARNTEIHFAQVRGEYVQPTGIVMPTFMPETG